MQILLAFGAIQCNICPKFRHLSVSHDRIFFFVQSEETADLLSDLSHKSLKVCKGLLLLIDTEVLQVCVKCAPVRAELHKASSQGPLDFPKTGGSPPRR